YTFRPLPHSSMLFPYTTLFRSLTSALGIPLKVSSRRLGRLTGVGRLAGIGRRSTANWHAGPSNWRVQSVGVINVGIDGNGEGGRSEEHTSELQSRENLVCRLLL